MKKMFILAIMIFILCGCTNVRKAEISDIVNSAITSKKDYTNTIKVGFKYYKPVQMSTIESAKYNEVLRSDDNIYYLYVDIVSYYNKTNNDYVENDISYYSKKISNGDKLGYIEINEMRDNQYLIEIMYNYAKIEVMVDKEDINEAVAFASSILSSIKYNDIVVNNTLGKDVFNSFEENIDIFKSNGTNKNVLKYVETYRYDKDVIPDMDLVN